MNAKRAERAEKFKIIGARITAQAWRDRIGDHQYEIKGRACADSKASSRMYGPQLRTLQWERTSK